MRFSITTTSFIAVSSFVVASNAAVAPPAYDATPLAAPTPVSYAAGSAPEASSSSAATASLANSANTSITTVSAIAAIPYSPTSQEHTTVHYTRTTILTRTLTSTLTSSSASSLSIVAPSSRTVYTLEGLNSTSITSTTSLSARPLQTQTIITMSSSLCEAGQTVTQSGQATVLTTPSMSSFLATSILTPALCSSLALESAPASQSSATASEPLSSYVPLASTSAIYFSSQVIPTAPIATKQFAPSVSTSASSSLLVPVSGTSSRTWSSPSPSVLPADVSGASRSAAAVGSAFPNAASSVGSGPAPYSSPGSSTAVSYASGTGVGTGTIGMNSMPTSLISPYNPNLAVAGTPTYLNMVGACAAFAVAFMGYLL